MRKREMDELMQDFIARGGKVTIIPPVAKEETTHTLSVKSQLNYDTLSLGDGEFYFGETRRRKTTKQPKKKVNTEDFAKMVESSNLPSHVIEALKKSIGAKK